MPSENTGAVAGTSAQLPAAALAPQLQALESDGLLRRRRLLQSPQQAVARVDGREVVAFCSNDYLGLAADARLRDAACEGAARYGAGSGASHLILGHSDAHHALESALADFVSMPRALLFSTGYMANLGVVTALVGRGDAIFADKLNHASLNDAAQLSRAEFKRYQHGDLAMLERALAAHPARRKLVITDAVFSMDGDVAPVPALLELCERYDAWLLLDDAHGFGVLGRQGRGTADHFGLTDKVDLVCGSLSKSLASTGGFIASSRDVIDYLRTNSKQTIFSAAISPGQAACAQASLELMQQEPQHLERLWANTRKYRAMLKSLGLDTWESETPAVPIVLGSKERVYPFWKALLEKGVFTVMSIAPAVPAGKDLIRTAVSAMHTDEQFDRIAEAMSYAVKRL